MNKSIDFLTFLEVYAHIVGNASLSLAEKTAALEAAGDEFLLGGRLQATAYRKVVETLSRNPPRETHGPSDVKTKPPVKGPAKGRVVSRSGR